LRTTPFRKLTALGFLNTLAINIFSNNHEVRSPRISIAKQGYLNGVSMDRGVAASFGKAAQYGTKREHCQGERTNRERGSGQTPGEAYAAGKPVDMMDKAGALPTSPQAQQQQHDMTNRILAA
jgi:hypothetical protein